MQLKVNGRNYEIGSSGDTPLLWVLRDEIGLTGSKYGCGVGACGACTVLINDTPVRSCSYPLSAVASGAVIKTIEGLASENGELHPVQKAWLSAQVPQCGYCQSGMIMAAVALLKNNPKPSQKDIEEGISNICRCGTYPRVVGAIEALAGSGLVSEGENHG